jgi:putative phage-type endonuclease
MAKITVRDEAHWHELRAKNIGGSDVSALFGLSSFSTRWQLWMEKAGKLPAEDLDGNKAVQAGKFLEAGIAQWAAAIWNWNINKVEEYHTANDVPGMGATLDYALASGVPVEIKWNSGFGDGWKYEGDTIIEAPENYILQVQHQLACYDSGAEYAWLVVLLRNEPRRMKVPRHNGIISTIKQEVADFWQSINDGVEPDPDFNLDADAIDRLMEQVPLTDVDLGEEHAVLYNKYLDAAATEKLAQKAKESAKSELLLLAKERMEGANTKMEKAIIRCGNHKMTISTVAPNFGTKITEDMVGTVIGTRKGYQRVSIS